MGIVSGTILYMFLVKALCHEAKIKGRDLQWNIPIGMNYWLSIKATKEFVEFAFYKIYQRH